MSTTALSGPRGRDALLALGLLAALGVPSVLLATGEAWPALLADSIAAVAMPVAVCWRRRHPVVSTAVVLLGALLHFALGSAWLPVDVVILVALYSVTVHGPVWVSRLALAATLLGAGIQGVGATAAGRGTALGLVALVAAVAVTVWALGLARRNRLRHALSLAEREQRLTVQREQQVQIAAAAERARIAREMHDVVAHSLSVVIAQADGGRYAAGHDARAAEHALTTIADTGRAALADMRKLLGVLRAPGHDEPGTTPTPQPLEGDLTALVAKVRASGLDTSLVPVGEPRALPPGLGVTVYRICQEALTNTLKHAGPAVQATVLVQWAPQRLVLQVDDTGHGAAADGNGDSAGHGLVGMQERVDVFGGTLQAGPRPDGGFRVRVELPTPALERLPRHPSGGPTTAETVWKGPW